MHDGIGYSGGEADDCRRLADAQQPVLFTSTDYGELPPAIDCPGGAALSGIVRQGGHGGTQYPDRAQPAPGGTYYEEVLMRVKGFFGPCPDV